MDSQTKTALVRFKMDVFKPTQNLGKELILERGKLYAADIKDGYAYPVGYGEIGLILSEVEIVKYL